jgi:hypothetical protein
MIGRPARIARRCPRNWPLTLPAKLAFDVTLRTRCFWSFDNSQRYVANALFLVLRQFAHEIARLGKRQRRIIPPPVRARPLIPCPCIVVVSQIVGVPIREHQRHPVLSDDLFVGKVGMRVLFAIIESALEGFEVLGLV